ncbi:hypothetical protein AVEN_194218-1 [Araneus ventricosus]|uniref:Uncharacterized protein n=1 Tax=Araneus ventricosus TaxID=182803 RepID=A0A4Y2HGL6_ARAVE|nr:hypothetical protein AVEN_194218-1 [Araneus ventricosus]
MIHGLCSPNENSKSNDFIYNEAPTKVKDQVITTAEKDLSSFGMRTPRTTDEVSNDLMRDLEYDNEELQQRLNKFIPRLNPDQNTVPDNVLQLIESGDSCLFFLDAPDGNEKTFHLNILSLKFGKIEKIPFGKLENKGRFLYVNVTKVIKYYLLINTDMANDFIVSTHCNIYVVILFS